MIGLVGLFFLFIWVISAMGSAFSSKDAVVPKSAVLHLTFEDPIPELKNNLVQGNTFEFETDDKLGLQDILAAIETAKTDDNIKGIFIDPKGSVGGLASSLVVHKAISDFKESGKFIIAYSDYYSQGGYYMAALADKVVLNPIGNIDFRGFASVGPYFKDLLDKVGVKYQVFYAGQFKSATEPIGVMR
jgi:protease-4